jgi:hypothetical protein
MNSPKLNLAFRTVYYALEISEIKTEWKTGPKTFSCFFLFDRSNSIFDDSKAFLSTRSDVFVCPLILGYLGIWAHNECFDSKLSREV